MLQMWYTLQHPLYALLLPNLAAYEGTLDHSVFHRNGLSRIFPIHFSVVSAKESSRYLYNKILRLWWELPSINRVHSWRRYALSWAQRYFVPGREGCYDYLLLLGMFQARIASLLPSFVVGEYPECFFTQGNKCYWPSSELPSIFAILYSDIYQPHLFFYQYTAPPHPCLSITCGILSRGQIKWAVVWIFVRTW